MVVDPGASQLYCPHPPVFSPDGRQIAILAANVTCLERNTSAPPDESIGIFDTATGRLTRLVSLKEVMEGLVGPEGPTGNVAWSPDGKTLAVTTSPGFLEPQIAPYSTTDQQTAPHIITAPPLDPFKQQAQVWNLRMLQAMSAYHPPRAFSSMAKHCEPRAKS